MGAYLYMNARTAMTQRRLRILSVPVSACGHLAQTIAPARRQPDQAHWTVRCQTTPVCQTACAAGAQVQPVGAIDYSFLLLQGLAVTVNGADVQTYEYPGEAAAVACIPRTAAALARP
jgi:hypothetical protein